MTMPPPARKRRSLLATWGAALACAAQILFISATALADTSTLGTATLLEGPTAGSDSVVLAVTPEPLAWTATANVPWLHLTSGFESGASGTNVIFTFDANPSSTRTGTLTIAGQTVTVTQAGSTYVAAGPVTTLVGSGLNAPVSVAVDSAGNVYIADRNSSTIKMWTMANNTTNTLVASGLNQPNAVAVDDAGNVYIADRSNNAIKKWSVTNNTMTTLIGAGLNLPSGVAVDRAGNVYVADYGNNAIKKWSVTDSNLITLVNSGLNFPIGVAVDAAGNVYIADTFNNAIKKWTAANSNVTTLVSSGLNRPAGVAVDGAGNVYIANTLADTIRKWTAANNSVTTVASAGLLQPNGVAVDGAGNVYIASTGNNSVRAMPRAFVDPTTRLESAGAGSDTWLVALPTSVNLLPPFAPTSNQPWLTLSTVSNGVVTVNFTNNFGASRTANVTVLGVTVPVTQAAPTFNLATNAIAVAPASSTNSVALVTAPDVAPWTATNNNTSWLHLASGFASGAGSTNVVFTCDANPGALRIGTLTIAGQPLTVTQAALPLPEIGVEQPADNNLTDGSTTNDFGNGYVALTNLTKTFVITNSGATNLTGLAITKDGAHPADFIVSGPVAVTLAPNASTTFTVTFAPGAVGSRSANLHIASNDPDENPFDIALTGTGLAPNFSLAATTRLIGPTAGSDSVVLAATPEFSTWTATANTPWLHLNPANQSGTGSTNITFTFDANPGVTRTGTMTIAGKIFTVTQAGASYVAAGVVTTLALTGANQPWGIAVDGAGNVYFADQIGNAIKKWTATNNTVTTLINTGLNLPSGVAVDVVGNVYVADTANNAIKKWTATNGLVTTLVDTGLNYPYGVAVDAAGNVYVADTSNSAIKKWTATNGLVSTLVDTGLASPFGVTVDAAGNVYLADYGTSTVKKWTAANQTVITLIGAGLNFPFGIAVDSAGNVYLADSENHAIKKWTAANNALTTLIDLGINSPFGVAVDAAGNVFFSDASQNAIKELPRAFVTPTNKFAGFLAGSDVLPVVLPNNANLLAPFAPLSTQPWLTVSGITNGVISFNFAANPGASRTASLIVFGQTNTITQAALPVPEIGVQQPLGVDLTDNATTIDFGLVYASLTNSSKTFTITNSGSTNLTGLVITKNGTHPGDFIVSAPGSTNLPANSSTTFTITFTPTATGSRSAAIHIANNDPDENPFDISLVGTGIPPTFGLNPTSRSVGETAGSNSVALTTTPGNAPWTATANAAWLHLNPANQSGTGSSNIGFNFDANPGTNRIGTLTIAGQTLTVTQAALSYNAALSATNWIVGPGAGSENVMLNLIPLTTSNWTATANAAWLHLSAANQSGTGSTNVIYTFDTNPGATRIGSLTIANQTLTVTQAGSNYVAADLTTPLASAGLNFPHGLATDAAGNVYIADTYNYVIKKWTVASNTVTTLVSGGLNLPLGVAVDGAGNVYIADTFNHLIKKWDVATGTITNLVAAGLNYPYGLAVDGAGNVYIADRNNSAIKKWIAASNTVTNLVTAGLYLPSGVAVDAAGDVYIADTGNNAIKKWTAANGAVTTLVASGLNQPSTVAVDGAGNVYLADRYNNAIKKWLVASNTVVTLSAPALNLPNGVAVDGGGNVYIADTSNHAIKESPRAFVDQTARTVGNAASSNSLPPVLPPTVNLLAPFAPTSNQPWLTINSGSAGVINFSCTANPGGSRSATLTVLGRSILVTQTLVATSPTLASARVPAGLALSFAANVGQLYQIESAPTVTGPWTTNATLIGPANGILNYTNPIASSGNRFFRTRTP